MKYHYPYPERFPRNNLVDLSKITGDIVLWGAGKIGGLAAHCLTQKNIIFAGYCDISKDKIGQTFCGHPVFSPKQLKELYPEATILISTSFFRTALLELEELGWNRNKIFNCVSLFLEVDFSNYDFWAEPQFIIRSLEEYMNSVYFYTSEDVYINQLCLSITSRCTLRCKYCSAYVPYTKNHKDLPIESVISDLKLLFDAIHFIDSINILGGEPFLYPQLGTLLKFLHEIPLFRAAPLITNGTLIPSEDVLQLLEEDKRFVVRFSHYGALSTKLEEFVELCKKRDISYEIVNYAYWNPLPKIGPTASSENMLKRRFLNCTSSTQLPLVNGKLFCCCTLSSMHLQHLDAIPDNPNDYVDLRKSHSATELREAIKCYLNRFRSGEYLSACAYCTGVHSSQFENKIPVAEQTHDLLTF